MIMNAPEPTRSSGLALAHQVRSLAFLTVVVLAGCGGDDSSTADVDTAVAEPVAEDVAETDADPEAAATEVIDALNAEGDALMVPQLEYDFWADASPLPPTVNYAVFCEREAQIVATTFTALPTSVADPAVDPAYQDLRAARLAYTNEQDRICIEIATEEATMPVEVLDEFLATLDRERDRMTLACVDALEPFSPYGVLNCSREPIATSAPADFVLDMPPPEIMQRADVG